MFFHQWTAHVSALLFRLWSHFQKKTPTFHEKTLQVLGPTGIAVLDLSMECLFYRYSGFCFGDVFMDSPIFFRTCGVIFFGNLMPFLWKFGGSLVEVWRHFGGSLVAVWWRFQSLHLQVKGETKTATKLPPNCHQTSTKLPPNFHQTATKLPPNFHQTATKLPPKCHQISTKMSPNFKKKHHNFKKNTKVPPSMFQKLNTAQ